MTEPIIVECEYFQKNERWFGYRFYHKPQGWVIQVYGADRFDAEARLHEQLIRLYGALNYSIKITNELKEFNLDLTACHDSPVK